MHKFPFRWKLSEANFTKDKGKVFSCFACGGGSTMGYKLAGFDVLGCNEIDERMIKLYRANHHPKLSFLEPIQTFKTRTDLPKELYELDILDGSPPCSSFSMAGARDDHWGKEKKFTEGQQLQVLDTLFFDFIELTKELQPKVVIAENVTGILIGKANAYVARIYKEFDAAGYDLQHFELDASQMGVPQRRQRVFFIGLRKDLSTPFMVVKDLFTMSPDLTLSFKEKSIPFGEIRSDQGLNASHTQTYSLLQQRIPSDKSIGDINMRLNNKLSGFTNMIVDDDDIAPTIASAGSVWRGCDNTLMSDTDLLQVSSFPLDYDFGGKGNTFVKYVVGMSVPPVMMAHIAEQVHSQWLAKL